MKFYTSDGGSTIAVEDLSRNQDPIYLPGFETVTSNANLSVSVTTSVINLGTGYNGNLPSGVEGQTKIVVCGNATPGTQVLTVPSAGWKNAAAGNVTFTGQGQSATLFYLGGAWWCTSTGPDQTNGYPVVA